MYDSLQENVNKYGMPSSKRCIQIMTEALALFRPFAPTEQSDLYKIPVPDFIKMQNVNLIPYSKISKTQLKKLQSLTVSVWEEGLFYKNDDGVNFIYYDDSKTEEEIEVILFHELGHMILNHTQQSNLAETEAYCFACVCLGFLTFLRNIKREAA